MRNVLSLCDGMSCGQIALLETGVKFEKYYASEIDKPCIAQTQLNFPETIQLGDIQKWETWEIDWSSVDLILSGTPCQGFSSAGLRKGLEDPRSKLFLTFLDILNYVKTKNSNVKFLFENVKMKLTDMSIISNKLRSYPIEIDAALVSAQERKRFYWSNIKSYYMAETGLNVTSIPLPVNKGVRICDILDEDRDFKIAYLRDYKRIEGIHINKRGLAPFRRIKGKQTGISEVGQVRFDTDKTPTLTAKNNGIKIIFGELPENLFDTAMRELNVNELTRLQTIPEWYTWRCSDTQRKKMLGNGWNVEVIKHILSYYEEI